MKKIVSKHLIALALSVTLLIGMLAAGLPVGAADVYEVTVGFDQTQVNDNGTVYLPLTTEDGKAIMDIYGDWTTAFGTIYVDGAEWPGTAYSITGNYFYMGGLGMNNISKIEIKAGTELTPDTSCLSTMPIVIKNDLTLVKADGVWVEQQPVAADVYEVTVGFDQTQVNDNGTVYLPLTTEDGKVMMDTYGDWTTAFGTIYVDGAEWPGTGYSITGNYFYMGGLGMNNISKIEIKAGTELTPDTSCLSTMPIVIKNDLTLVKTDGVWAEQVVEEEKPTITLGLVNVGADNTWELTVDDISRFEAQYYCVEATVDGVTGRIALEKSGNNLVIWPSFFGIGGISVAPAQNFTIAEGAILEPVDPNTSGWNTVIAGTQFTLASAFSFTNYNGTWSDTPIVEPIDLGMTFNNINTANDWAFSAVADTLPTANQWFAVAVKLDGADRTVLMEYDANATWFYVYHHCFWPTPNDSADLLPQSSLVIPAGTVLTPISTPDASAVIEGGQTYQLTADVDMVFENGAWTDKNAVPPAPPVVVTPLDAELTFQSVNSNNDWAFTAVAEGLPTVNTWYTTTATVDGTDRAVLVEYDANAQLFYIYYHCFGTTPGVASYPAASLKLVEGAILTPISTPDASAVIEGGQTYKLTAEVDVALEDGAWTDQNAAPPVVVTPLDAELTFYAVNSNNDWAFTAVAEGLPTTNAWYAVPVKLDGTDRTVLMEYDTNAQLFYVYHHCFWPTPNDSADLLPQTNLTIPVDTVFAPLSTPDASTVIEGGQTLKLTKAVSITMTDGEWADDNQPKPTYTDLTVDKMTVVGYADQPQQLRSYFQLSVVDALPQAGAEWWNDYDVYNVTVTVDGKEMIAALGGGGNAATLALYIPWATAEDAILANASEIIVKAGSKGRVGLEGIVFPSDLRIYNDNGVWKTDYDPTEDVDLSNAVQVGVTLDHVDGANRLYLSALMSDGSKIMDTYGDWTTAFGSIRMGTLNADGTYTWTEDPVAAWSITGSYFYMSALQLDMYDAIEIKKGTVLLPDASCKSQDPIVIANDFRMARDEWEEWVVDDGFTGKPDFSGKPNVPGSSNTGDNTKAPIAWIIVGACVAVLVLCLVLGGKKSRRQ